jgi:hypothetical protein
MIAAVSAADWTSVGITAALTLVGLYLANSVARRARAERETAAIGKRFTIYPALWTATKLAAPMEEVVGGGPLSEADRRALYATLDGWFWDQAGGMVLGEPSRTIYLRAKENLRLEDDALWPPTAAAIVASAPDAAVARSELTRRQLSLLRTAMRADLGIVGRVYRKPLSDADKDFLRRAGAKLWQRPWWRGSWTEWVAERVRRRPAEHA